MIKKIGNVIIGLILIGIIIISVSIGGLFYKKHIKVKSQNIDREIFKETKSYNEGIIQDLSKNKLELRQTKDKDARKAIIEYILEKYSNFNEDRIENRELRNFLIEVRNGEIK